MKKISPKNMAWLPSDEQKLLLSAALGEREEAYSAWLQWRENLSSENFSFETLDRASKRLLPLIYQNLRQSGVEETLLPPQLKKTRAETFRDNQLLFRETERIILAFETAGIRSLLLKGAALSVLYYNSSAARPMSDIDLLIEPANIFRAAEILEKNGWQTDEKNLSLLVQVSHSCPFTNPNGRELDLHWNLMRDCWHSDKNECFWESAVPLGFGAAQTLTLSHTDQLFHVCCHGARANANAPIRWIADATMILRTSAAEIDWERLLELADQRRFNVVLYLSLKYLEENFAAPVPPRVLEKLAAKPITIMERVSFQIFAEENSPSWTLRRYALELAFQYSNLRTRTPLRPPSRIFVRYLQYTFELESVWQVPMHLFRECVRRCIFKKELNKNKILAAAK